MDIDLTLFGQIIVMSLLAAAAGTFWYARRPGAHTTVGTLLVVCAWVVPIVGPIALLIFLAARPSDVAKEISVPNTNDRP